MIPAKVVTDTGRVAYHAENEQWDDSRHVVMYYGGKAVDCGMARLKIVHPFWKDEDERKRYERAALEIPRWKHLSMPLEKYLSEVVVLATGMAPQSVKSMPKAEYL